MSYLLDTDWIVAVLAGEPEATTLMTDLRRGGIAISVITHTEIMEGLADTASYRQTRRGYRLFLRRTRMIVVNRSVAEQAATTRADLRSRKRPVNHRVLDILIAATAIEHGLTLVTRNVRDYADIPGLRLYESI